MAYNKIQVFARLKPSKRPTEKLKQQEENSVVVHTSEEQGDGAHSKAPGLKYQFKFTKVFDTATTQDALFETVGQPIAEKFIDGYNGTIFAYGQTGSGKTFTIEGSARRFDHRGLIPRVIGFIFESLERRTEEDWRVEVSYMEVYQDTGYDLLNPGGQGSSLMVKLPKVRVHESPDGGVLVKNLSLHLAANEEVAHSLLFQGSANRKVAETSMNLQSSRSHAVFSIMLTRQSPGSDIIIKSKLNLVDLAGSERVAKTLANGRILNEAKHINLSLHHLEHVIVALQQKGKGRSTSGQTPRSPNHTPSHPPSRQRREDSAPTMLSRQPSGGTLSSARNRPQTRSHVPYRNCLLTMVLRDSLGGNCFTAMVATLSTEESNLGENISTCRFAQRVACISNAVRRNEEMDDKVHIKRLKKRVAELEAEVEQLRQELSTPQHQQQQQPRAVSPVGKLAPTSNPLTEGERKNCHQILHSYLHGKLDDPITAGIDDSRKVQECMKVMKDIVLHALGLGKGGAGGAAAVQPSGKNTSVKNGHVKHQHISPDSSLGKSAQYPTIAPGSRNSSGFGSIPDEDNHDTSPLHQSQGSHTQQSHDLHTQQSHDRHTQQSHDRHMQQSHDRHVTMKHPKSPFIHQVESTFGDVAKEGIHKHSTSVPQRSNRMEAPQRSQKTPQRASSKGGAGGVLEAKIANMVRSEDEKRKLVMTVQELQIKVKEEEIRSELDLTKEQLAHQHARVLSLQQRGVEEEEVCQERLAEQQLRLKQAKLFQQLLDIEHALKLHHITDTHTSPPPRMPENVPQGPKSPNSPSTRAFERQLMAEVASHEKQQTKVDKQIDTLRASQAEKQLELREAATKRKLLALKQQLNASMSPTSDPAPPLSPRRAHHTLDTTTATPMSPHPQPSHHTSSATVQKPMGSYTAPAVQQNRRPQLTPHQDMSSPITSNGARPSSNLFNCPPPPVTGPHSPPSHYPVYSPPPTSHPISPPDTPTHAVEGMQSRNGTTRNGMSALKARLMISQESNRSKHAGTGSGRWTGGRDQMRGSTLPHKEGKEVEFMSVAQQQKERVQRIRVAMHAAIVIQRSWRRYRSRVKGKT